MVISIADDCPFFAQTPYRDEPTYLALELMATDIYDDTEIDNLDVGFYHRHNLDGSDCSMVVTMETAKNA